MLAYVKCPRARGGAGPSTSTERTLTLIALVFVQQLRCGPVAVLARGLHYAAHELLRSSASLPLRPTTSHCHCRGPHIRQLCRFENGIQRRQRRSITVTRWRSSSRLINTEMLNQKVLSVRGSGARTWSESRGAGGRLLMISVGGPAQRA